MLAFVREVGRSLARCELTYLARAAIDVSRAQHQHARYVAELSALGCRLEWLPPLAEHADGVFVEDTAVLLPEVAVITRPGAASRRDEVETVATALARHAAVRRVTEPACLEGGDVLHIDRTLYVGASGRTNAAGIAQLAEALQPFGYAVRQVVVRGCLHLKSAATFIPPNTLLVNPAWVDPAAFDVGAVIAVDPEEAYAANTLTLRGLTLVSGAYPRTQQRLQAAGILTRAVDVSELQKAEAALTCMSLLLEPAAALSSQ
ncbi:MAG TPA: arginine deiminase family protein [Steroidobacteraceae bacterium]